MLEIDGSRYSGSGTIVRQAVALAALTGKDIRIINVRLKRPKPGLRRQHVQVVESIRQLVGGRAEGVTPGSREIVFRPGKVQINKSYVWDIGSAGSTTALAIAVLPVLAFGAGEVSIELRGGLFQDFAPSYFHFEQVLLPLLLQMGIQVTVHMERPGYVPTGGGILRVAVAPVKDTLRSLIRDAGPVERIWGIALSSHLQEQAVSDRMAEAAKKVFARAGYKAQFTVIYEESAGQRGAGMAAFADLSDGSRLGSDRAGAPGRRSEAIGRQVAHNLLGDLATGASLEGSQPRRFA